MVFTKQLTNGKRGADHVASDPYNRANRWAAFLPQDIFQVDVVEGGYADNVTDGISERILGGSFPQDSCEVDVVEGGYELEARRLVIINPDVSVSDNLAVSYTHLQFFYFQFSHGVVVLGGESYGFCALDLWVPWWGCST